MAKSAAQKAAEKKAREEALAAGKEVPAETAEVETEEVETETEESLTGEEKPEEKKAPAVVEEKEESDLVEVMVLKHVGAYTPGPHKVDAKTAKDLCHVNEIEDGMGGKTIYCRAMLLSEHKAITEANLELSDLTAAEAAELGLKNVTDSSKSEIAQVNQLKKEE